MNLCKEETVLDVDAGKEVHLMMDSVRILTHVDEVHVGIGLPTSYQGEGTIIGIIDRGFDFTHPNFRDEMEIVEYDMYGIRINFW